MGAVPDEILTPLRRNAVGQLEILKIGNPVLRQKPLGINPGQLDRKTFQNFLDQMVETMHGAEGVGLAANQVGREVQAIVLECKMNSRYPGRQEIPLEIYVNPRIVQYSSEKMEDWEGCLSIPGYRGKVTRSAEVTFEALTREGRSVKKTVSGFHARIIQHEVDHLSGLFYMDRMNDLQLWMHLEEFNRHFGLSARE